MKDLIHQMGEALEMAMLAIDDDIHPETAEQVSLAYHEYVYQMHQERSK